MGTRCPILDKMAETYGTREPEIYEVIDSLWITNRCVVPATSFSEYGQQPDPVTNRRPLHWFALNEEKPLFWFAGVWTTWYGLRKKKEGPVHADIFAFLTTDANGVVAPIHPKAMPVILRTTDEIDIWIDAPVEEALKLQGSLPDGDFVLLPPERTPELLVS